MADRIFWLVLRYLIAAQGAAYFIMGAYFTYVWQRDFHEWGPGPFGAAIGLFAVFLGLWLAKEWGDD